MKNKKLFIIIPYIVIIIQNISIIKEPRLKCTNSEIKSKIAPIKFSNWYCNELIEYLFV